MSKSKRSTMKEEVVEHPGLLRVSRTDGAIAVGFVYLAAILDAWSRRVIGYAISSSYRFSLSACGLKSGNRQPAATEGLHITPIAARNMS